MSTTAAGNLYDALPYPPLSYVQAARRSVDRLGLPNIEFEHTDIRDFKLTSEPFDFVIARGFYS